MPKPDSILSTLVILLIIAMIAVAVILLTSDKVSPAPGSENGTLTGTVSIGPLCPMEPCNISDDRIASAYAARTIIISDPKGSVVAFAVPDPRTGYTVALKPGTYIVDIPRQGIGGSNQLPKTVIIRAGETIRLDISIDTGIR
jgi:hypothetical protein